MKFLITGSRGMLGTDVVGLFQQTYEVLGCDLHNCDILNECRLEETISSFRPDVIIHTAAYTNVDKAESDAEAAALLNERGVEFLAKAAKKYQAKLVYISTDYVFDGRNSVPYTENDEPNPLGVYGNTKLRGEQQLQRILDSKHWLIVRTAWLYGKHGKNFVSAILQRAREIGELQVVNDQQGAPTYTRDLAAGILSLLESDAAGIFHFSNSGQCSWYDFAESIIAYAGLSHVPVQPLSSDDLKRPAPRPGYSVMDTSKFAAVTGRSPRHWKKALEAYFEEVTS
ncbi:MAG: dTDP-4-dehydrorhamnose reductase [bacterium]|nr:dTDP-4-dehydrorhamnose reductase [bacterium]